MTELHNWEADKSWSDIFVPEIKAIIGEHLVSTGNHKQDTLEASDFIVMEVNPIRIGCRIRKNSYLKKESYRREFTIRSGRPSGNQTELAKIMSGWGTHLFYGFSDESEKTLAQWFIGDLSLFRLTLWRNRRLLDSGFRRANFDDSSWFYAWNVSAFPDDFVVASSRSFGTRQEDQPF